MAEASASTRWAEAFRTLGASLCPASLFLRSTLQEGTHYAVEIFRLRVVASGETRCLLYAAVHPMFDLALCYYPHSLMIFPGPLLTVVTVETSASRACVERMCESNPSTDPEPCASPALSGCERRNPKP